MLRNVVTFLLFTLLALPAHAKPPELSDVIAASVPRGQGTLDWLWITAYRAELWGDNTNLAPPYALSITYNMDFSTDDLVGRSVDEIARAHPLTDTERTAYTTALQPLLPAVKEGDRITALVRGPDQLEMYHNGIRTGTLADATLITRFMGIWLAPTTSEPDLRVALLGEKQ
jgi:hypothetical protein